MQVQIEVEWLAGAGQVLTDDAMVGEGSWWVPVMKVSANFGGCFFQPRPFGRGTGVVKLLSFLLPPKEDLGYL